jgi:membrane-associated protein
VLAAHGQLSLPTAIAVGAAGVLCGDLAWYAIGRMSPPRSTSGGPPASQRGAALLRPGRPWVARLAERGTVRAAARFTRGLRRPGPLVILLGRFVPGGRMAACFFAGRSRYSGRRFLVYEVLAAVSWATYGGMVGHIGGNAVTESAWLLLAIAALGAAIFATAGWLLAMGQRLSPVGEA